MATDWLLPELKTRLKTAQQDLSSLVDFEAHLSGKTQFLLDAILGFINTEQMKSSSCSRSCPWSGFLRH